MKMTDKIKFKFVRANWYTRWPCHVCGGCTEQVSILCEARLPVSGGTETTMRVCERCLEAGQDQIDRRLRDQIEELEGHARDLRNLVGRLDIPAFEEWERAMDDVNAEYEEAEFRETTPVSYLVDGKVVQPPNDGQGELNLDDFIPF
jgi:hypothetical protein